VRDRLRNTATVSETVTEIAIESSDTTSKNERRRANAVDVSNIDVDALRERRRERAGIIFKDLLLHYFLSQIDWHP
jgi:outer membrane lipopolysaccharide assembly protein LptE/RlpB